MSRRRAARPPRATAEARPHANASTRAASRVDALNTARNDRARQAAGADPLTDAQVLVGTTSWLVSLSDWLTEELDLADGESVRLRRSDVERMRDGLIRCVACLDTLAVDPAQLPALDSVSTKAALSPVTSSPRTLQ